MTTQYTVHPVSAQSLDQLSCTLLSVTPVPLIIVPAVDIELYEHLRNWLRNISGEITVRDIDIMIANYVHDKEVELEKIKYMTEYQ